MKQSYTKEVNPELGPDIAQYDATTALRYTRYVVTTLASLLPMLCIIVLWSIHSVGWRLGVMAMFTAAFAGILVIFTAAREVEIFASTAA